MLTVAIPALNEAANIANVVRFALAHHAVCEVIVVDDGSIDDTVRLAREAGAKVITSTLLGKGPSMRDAVDIASGEFVLYLDGDMHGLDEALVDTMLAPFENGADFVKARFARASGRVTELTARPLLRTFFPELAAFGQPLGGIMAARTELLRRMKFEDDFGVDVGLLIDAHFLGARVVEVDVGQVEHDSKPLANLSRMAAEVSRAILCRAELVSRLHPGQLTKAMEYERLMGAELDTIAAGLEPGGKLALLDMDGTLLAGRFVVALAQRLGLEAALSDLLDNQDMDACTRTAAIAALFRAVPQRTFVEVAKSIPMNSGVTDAVVSLRRQGYRVGIVSDSYFIAADVVRRRVFADFAVAHIMIFADGEATGEVRISDLFRHPNGCKEHDVCKRNVLCHLLDFTGMPFTHTLMVGDGDNDACLAQAVDTGYAYRSTSTRLTVNAMPLHDWSTLISPRAGVVNPIVS